METEKQNWNDFYTTHQTQTPDNWLEKYVECFHQGDKVLDLGCGSDSNIPFLLKQEQKSVPWIFPKNPYGWSVKIMEVIAKKK